MTNVQDIMGPENRAELVSDGFDIDRDVDASGIIRSPGKFEAEPYYVVRLYGLAMEGCQDDTIDFGQFRSTIDLFFPARDYLTDAERRFFRVRGDDALALECDEQGFVGAWTMTLSEIERMRAEAEEAAGED